MFGKLKRTAAQNDDGNGMGLMFCQNLVKQSGGSISAYSKGKNLGAVISFTMSMKTLQKKSISLHSLSKK